MQSWGTRSRFDERDSDLEPSKSGVLGLICAALGRDRHEQVNDLAALRMGVRVDQPGILRYDYLTAQDTGSSKRPPPTVISRRYYLADATFLVGLEGDDQSLLERLHAALKNPVWPLSLGRKAYLPSEPVFLEPPLTMVHGLSDLPLYDALRDYPPLGREETSGYRFLIEDPSTGALRMDQPLAPFAQRTFGARYVQSLYGEVTYVPEQTQP
jgi:CRISPR system Cascade subunit CasD